MPIVRRARVRGRNVMATVIEHGPECDGYRIVVRLTSGALHRFHAAKKPTKLAEWANEREAEMLAVVPEDPKRKALDAIERALGEVGDMPTVREKLEQVRTACLSAR